MRKFAIFVAVPALLLVMALPAYAEGGWSSSQMSSPTGDRGGRNSGSSYDPYLGETRRMIDTGSSAAGYSGGVGDQTGHSAQMHDKAQPPRRR